MECWKFLINRLLIFIGMIGSFIGATLGYYEKIVEATRRSVFKFFAYNKNSFKLYQKKFQRIKKMSIFDITMWSLAFVMMIGTTYLFWKNRDIFLY